MLNVKGNAQTLGATEPEKYPLQAGAVREIWVQTLERTDPSEQKEEQRHPKWEKQCEQSLVSDVEGDLGGGIFYVIRS